VSENRELRRISGPKKDEIKERWTKLHIEDLHILHSSPNIIRMINLKGTRWEEYVAGMGEKCIQNFGR
jgi:hypothetical protein